MEQRNSWIRDSWIRELSGCLKESLLSEILGMIADYLVLHTQMLTDSSIIPHAIIMSHDLGSSGYDCVFQLKHRFGEEMGFKVGLCRIHHGENSYAASITQSSYRRSYVVVHLSCDAEQKTLTFTIGASVYTMNVNTLLPLSECFFFVIPDPASLIEISVLP